MMCVYVCVYVCVQAYPTLRTVWVIVSHPDNASDTSKTALKFAVCSDIVQGNEHPLGAAKFVLMAMHVTRARCGRMCSTSLWV